MRMASSKLMYVMSCHIARSWLRLSVTEEQKPSYQGPALGLDMPRLGTAQPVPETWALYVRRHHVNDLQDNNVILV